LDRYVDIVDFIMNVMVLHITDIDTLNCVMRRDEKSSISSNYFDVSFASVKRLHLTFRFPLAFYKILEQLTTPSAAESSLNPNAHGVNTGLNSQITLWLQLYDVIAQLKKLSKLQISLDHDDKKTWSIVNERVILSPLTPFGSQTDFKFVVDLPKLHPHWEKPVRHFTADSSRPPFTVHRRLRQGYFGTTDNQGQLCAMSYVDFPSLRDHHGLQHLPLEELESFERKLWEGGDDAWRIFEEPMYVCR
jgi:hypothetical protein